jgi:peptidoglycan/LPS O-acetylase OafA/YrhL
MRAPHTRASGASSLAATGLAGAQLLALTTIDTRYVAVLATVLVLLTVFATFRLSRDNCVESRIVIAAAATASGVGIAANCTIGLPGGAPHPIQSHEALLLVAALLVLLAVAVEARSRRAVARSGSPYAL